jgi:hypothetical protein
VRRLEHCHAPADSEKKLVEALQIRGVLRLPRRQGKQEGVMRRAILIAIRHHPARRRGHGARRPHAPSRYL